MARRALVRGTTAVAVSLTLAMGLGPLTAGTAHGEPVAGEVVVPATTAMLPRTSLLSAGPSGFLRHEEGRGHLWTTYDGVDTVVDASAQDMYGVPGFGAGSDVVADHDPSTRVVTLRDMSTGQSRTVSLPAGHEYWATLGTTVVTLVGTQGTDITWHLLDTRDDGSFTDRAVEGVPEGIYALSDSNAALGDAHGQIVRYRMGNEGHTAWLDLDQGRLITLPYKVPSGYPLIALTATHLVWWYNGTAFIASRQDLTATPRTLPLADVDQLLGMVGDSLVVSRYDSSLGRYDYTLPVWRVDAVPLDGSPAKTLLARSSWRAMPTPDGGLLMPGGPSTDQWGVSLIEAAEGGGVAVRRIADAHPQRKVGEVSQLTLTQGRLNTVEMDPLAEWTYLHTRDISDAAGSLTVGPRTTRGRLALDNYTGGRPRLTDTGDGGTVVWGHGTSTAQQPHLLGPAQPLPGTRIDSSRVYEAVAVVSGRFAVLRRPYSGNTAEMRVVDTDTGRTVFTTTEAVEAMWGTTLWLRDGTGVVPVDVLTGQRGNGVWFGRGCLLSGLQAVGRWLLWSCFGSVESLGVYDTVTRTNRTLVSGDDWSQAELGDGFVAMESDGQLKVIDFRGATPVSHTVGKFEWGPWDVDPYTGVIAQLGADNAVHLIPSGIPVSPLAQLDATVATAVDVKGGTGYWSPKWRLNKPAASWQLAIRNKATGTTVRTLSGGLARGLVAPAWNGKDGSGRLVPNGTYTWTLTATPADGQGTALTSSGTVKLTGAIPVHHDFVASDGIGDLLTLNTSGALTYHRGDGAGKFSTRTTGSGWPTTVKVVPYGDLNGDRCNDVLVRLTNGALRAYKPGCGKAPTPSTPYTTLGTSGWTQYDILTSPGDLTGDGRADLIARQSSTGDVYLYKATSTGKLSPRTKLYSRWTGYKKIIGAGDLNGDGRADLLAQDKSNELWRYDGTGTGTFRTRVKLSNDWGASYNAVVAVGDITGDGKTDLISRDTSGDLWRNNGDGRGSFGARTKIATGWQGYGAVL